MDYLGYTTTKNGESTFSPSIKGTQHGKGPLGTTSLRKRIAGEGYEVEEEEEGDWEAIYPVCACRHI